jgi:hypothetical protein
MSMEVEIVKVYYGQETRKTVTVWGDNGNLCRPYLSIFKSDNYYVVHLNKTQKKIPRIMQFHCGDYWLTADQLPQDK